MTNQAKAAKSIRAELKEAFPGIKFSVKSEGFSGGDAVNIRYWDAIPTKEVEAITDRYQYGHFDGMTDMYESSNRLDDIPQSKYVHVSRKLTANASIKTIEHIKEKYGLEIEYEVKYDGYYDENLANLISDPWLESFGCWASTLIHREAFNLTFKN